MNPHFQQQKTQSATTVLARIMAATTMIFQRKEPAIPGLEVSDSTWGAHKKRKILHLKPTRSKAIEITVDFA